MYLFSIMGLFYRFLYFKINKAYIVNQKKRERYRRYNYRQFRFHGAFQIGLINKNVYPFR